MKRVLVIDDEENIGRSLKLILEREGYAVATGASCAEARAWSSRVDAYLLDVRLPDGNGIELLRHLRQSGSDAPVIMISGHGTIADAVEATRAGAYDFLEKPLGRDRVLLALKNALEQSGLREENERLREMVGSPLRTIGASPAWLRVVEQATMAARSDARVLLMGESGTGKELLAAHIHERSPFVSGPFVKVNCAAIPTELIESELFGHEKGAFTGAATARRGKFELADGGTLFLDEVGDLHGGSQAKLLRVLQEGEFHRVGESSPSGSPCGLSRRLTRTCRSWSRRTSFEKTCTTGCAWCRSGYPACASGQRTSEPWPNTSCPNSAPATISGRSGWTRASSKCSKVTTGPATRANCETQSSGWRS